MIRHALSRFAIVASLTTVLFCDVARADDKADIGYFLGISVGQQFAQSGFQMSDISEADFLKGMRDGVAKKDAAISDEQLVAAQQQIQTLLEGRMRQVGDDYLAKMAQQEGVQKLQGGLMFKPVAKGEGKSPAATDTVVVHYTGTLPDGTVFDSSVKRGEPAEFRVNQVIKGWQMALQKMKVGDKWMLYIPSDLAYGPSGSPPKIGPFEALTFEVELLEIK